MVFIYL